MQVKKWVCAAMVVLALPILLRAQSTILPLPSPALSTTTITIFLADSQMGVAGACQGGGNTLYFEAFTPEGSTQMSVRLIDADGRTVAISGGSMDSSWTTSYDPTSASQSLSLASALASKLPAALPGGITFSRESTALVSLAKSASTATIGTTPLRVDTLTAPATLPAMTADLADAAAQYDAVDAAYLLSSHDALGNLHVNFNGAALHTFRLDFPDEEDEDTGAMGVTEMSAAMFLANGTSLAQILGGDYIPDSWYGDMFITTPPTTVNQIQLSAQAGSAIRGAALFTRSTSTASADEKAVLLRIASDVRHNGLFPLTLASSCSPYYYYSRDSIWKKPTLVIAEHSGTIVRQGACNGRGSLNWYGHTTYCNHGTCPGAKSMSFKCMHTSGPLASPRYPPHAKVPNGQQGAGEMHSCYKTNYDVWSGLPCAVTGCNPGHNCHDDSWTQLRAIKGESYHLTGGARCNETTLYKSAPNCSD